MMLGLPCALSVAMPTLQRRNDGGFFIRNFHHDDHHTWQLRADGVRYLARRGVTEGSYFDTALMMQLHLNGWLSTASSPTPLKRNVSQAIPPALLSAVRRLHAALASRDQATAQHFVASSETNRAQVLAQLACGLGIRSWKPIDAVVLPLPEPTASGTGVDEAAVVTMRISQTVPVLVEETWIRGPDWRVLWPSLAKVSELNAHNSGALTS
jgi:hypothetical protein